MPLYLRPPTPPPSFFKLSIWFWPTKYNPTQSLFQLFSKIWMKVYEIFIKNLIIKVRNLIMVAAVIKDYSCGLK